jgi:hypothetical protein
MCRTVPAWWSYVIRVVFVGLLVCVSACAAPDHSLSTPSAHSGGGGVVGPMTSGDGNGGM